MGHAVSSIASAVTAPVRTAVSAVQNPGAAVKNPWQTALGATPGGSLLVPKGAGGDAGGGGEYNTQLASANGQPMRPQFDTLLGNDGLIKSQYQVNAPTVALGSEGLNQLKDQATRTGPSAWAGLQNQGIAQQEAQNVDLANQKSMGNTAQAQSSLAMQGGLSSGARERLASQGSRDSMLGAQQAHMGADQSRNQTAISDEQNRLNAASQLNGAENSAAKTQADLNQQQIDAQKQNIGNSLNDITQRRQSDMNAYQEQMQAWAAANTANATAASAPRQSSGLLGFLGI